MAEPVDWGHRLAGLALGAVVATSFGCAVLCRGDDLATAVGTAFQAVGLAWMGACEVLFLGAAEADELFRSDIGMAGAVVAMAVIARLMSVLSDRVARTSGADERPVFATVGRFVAAASIVLALTLFCHGISYRYVRSHSTNHDLLALVGAPPPPFEAMFIDAVLVLGIPCALLVVAVAVAATGGGP